MGTAEASLTVLTTLPSLPGLLLTETALMDEHDFAVCRQVWHSCNISTAIRRPTLKEVHSRYMGMLSPSILVRQHTSKHDQRQAVQGVLCQPSLRSLTEARGV